eukprot:symbB.v1.2.006017.t1/scaffold356.1/size220710/14
MVSHQTGASRLDKSTRSKAARDQQLPGTEIIALTSQVLTYHTPPPVPILIGSLKLFSTAIWVPPLFGFAGFLIGSLYWLIDDFLQIPKSQRQPSLSQTLAAVVVFTANYVASGVMRIVTEASSLVHLLFGCVPWDTAARVEERVEKKRVGHVEKVEKKERTKIEMETPGTLHKVLERSN